MLQNLLLYNNQKSVITPMILRQFPLTNGDDMRILAASLN